MTTGGALSAGKPPHIEGTVICGQIAGIGIVELYIDLMLIFTVWFVRVDSGC